MPKKTQKISNWSDWKKQQNKKPKSGQKKLPVISNTKIKKNRTKNILGK